MSPFMDQYGQMHYEGAAKIKVGVFSSHSFWAFFFIHSLPNLPPVSFSYFIISVRVFKGGGVLSIDTYQHVLHIHSSMSPSVGEGVARSQAEEFDQEKLERFFGKQHVLSKYAKHEALRTLIAGLC
jgi:hypothetical protein